jgi:hypothetical protein
MALSRPNDNYKTSPSGLLIPSTADNPTLNAVDVTWEIATPSDATKYLRGAATPVFAQVKDSDLAVSDVTTNNVSISAHGFAPKAPNDTTKFLRAGNPPSWEVVGGSTSIVATDTIWDTKGDLAVATGADAASKLPVGSDGTVLIADSTQTTGVKWGAVAGGIGAILYDYTVSGADKASIDTFVDGTYAGNLSGAYTTLMILLYARTDETLAGNTLSTLNIILNNDTAANYDFSLVQQNNGTVSGAASTGNNQFRLNVAGASTAANIFGLHRFSIHNYAGTVGYKSVESSGGTPSSTGAQAQTITQVGNYRSTSAITRIGISTNTAGKKLKIGSRLTVLAF